MSISFYSISKSLSKFCTGYIDVDNDSRPSQQKKKMPIHHDSSTPKDAIAKTRKDTWYVVKHLHRIHIHHAHANAYNLLDRGLLNRSSQSPFALAALAFQIACVAAASYLRPADSLNGCWIEYPGALGEECDLVVKIGRPHGEAVTLDSASTDEFPRRRFLSSKAEVEERSRSPEEFLNLNLAQLRPRKDDLRLRVGIAEGWCCSTSK